MITFQESLNSVRSLLEEHNTIIGNERNSGFIDVEEFFIRLKASGGTSLERIKWLSFEEILCFMKYQGTVQPFALARDIAKVFRQQVNEDYNVNAPAYVSDKKIARMSTKELLSLYDINEPNNKIGKRLKEISNNESFIVLKSDNTVDVDTSFKLYFEIKDGFKGREFIDTADGIKPVYKVGEKPAVLVDENPLYLGRSLRPDGTCDQLNRSWDGINLEDRQLARCIYVDRGCALTIDQSHEIMDCLIAGNKKKLKERYMKAFVTFEEEKRLGTLPQLKIIPAVKNKINNVLKEGKKVQW